MTDDDYKNMTSAQKFDYWKEILEDWKSSGLSLNKWCQHTNRSFYMVRYWMRRIIQPAKNSFIEVKDTPSFSQEIRICVGNTHIIVEKGFDPIFLRQVIQALGGS